MFIVNEENPVESLTIEQVYDIFTGKITNWAEVGGDDVDMKVFIRPETSGSQTLMRKLLVGDEDMAEAYSEYVATMEGMINEIRNYDNSASAIGYSVYYYASEMMGMPGIKFLKIEGVAPNHDTIADGSYTLVNDFYYVTRQDSSDIAMQIGDWLISTEGQSFVEECGYVSVKGD